MNKLKIETIYKNELDMECFARMLESPTQCYKFYWLDAIMQLMQHKDEMTFQEIIYQMFWDAWYSVTEYHLYLGPQIQGKAENYIEHAIHVIEKDSSIQLPIQKEQFFLLLEKNYHQIKSDVDGIIQNVPYRLLSSFLMDIGGNDPLWNQKKRCIAYLEKLNETVCLPYIIIDGRGANKKILIHKYWKEVFLDNYTLIRDWIKLKKIRYLQDRNPGVPGIIYKLDAEQEKFRKLEAVRELWTSYAEIQQKPLIDMYDGKEIIEKQLSIDHFIPWSYVTNDELWNLVPMDRNHNSSKGNQLPMWNQFFPSLVNVQFDLTYSIFLNEQLRKQFEKCKNQNLYASWALNELYCEDITKEHFSNVLDHYMKPIYESALLQGYKIWNEN